MDRLCLSPKAQLRRHHGDRCLHSPQFEQCPRCLGLHRSFVLFPVVVHPPFSCPSSLFTPFHFAFVSASFLGRHSRHSPGKMNVIRAKRTRQAHSYLLFQQRRMAGSKNAYENRRGGKDDENRDFSPSCEVYTIGSFPSLILRELSKQQE